MAEKADKVDYAKLSRGVYDCLNRMRKDPRSFVPKLEGKLKYFKGTQFRNPVTKITISTKEGANAVKSAIEELKQIPSLPELKWKEGIARSSMDHANDIGPKGLFAHKGSDESSSAERLQRYGQFNGHAESIDFYNTEPEEVVLALLIDDGNKQRSNRLNLLNQAFRYCGIASQKHSQADVCVVINFAADYMEAKIVDSPKAGSLGLSSKKPTMKTDKPPSLITLEANPVQTSLESLSKLVEYDKLAIEVFETQNRLRRDPKSFVPKLKSKLQYFEGSKYKVPGQITIVTSEGAEAVKEAINVLKKQAPLPEFKLREGIMRAARDHASDIGPKGLASHTGSDGSNIGERLDRYGKWMGKIAENIDFNSTEAEEIVMDLLIDDGNNKRGHRRNMLNPELAFCGIAAAKHSTRDICIVIDYASEFQDFPEAIGKESGSKPSSLTKVNSITIEDQRASQEKKPGSEIKVTLDVRPGQDLITIQADKPSREKKRLTDIKITADLQLAQDPKSTQEAKPIQEKKQTPQAKIGQEIKLTTQEPITVEDQKQTPVKKPESDVAVIQDQEPVQETIDTREEEVRPLQEKKPVPESKIAEGIKPIHEAKPKVEKKPLPERKLVIVDKSVPEFGRALQKIEKFIEPIRDEIVKSLPMDPESLESMARAVFDLQNKIRRDPKSIIPKIEAHLQLFQGNNLHLPGCIPIITQEGPNAYKEAIAFLEQAQPVDELEWNDEIFKACLDHAIDIGQSGSYSHTGSDGSRLSARLERYGRWNGTVGENIDFGSYTVEDVLVSLIVDDGNPARGHRKNLFNPKFRTGSVAASKHVEMEICFVFDYASEFTKPGEEHPHHHHPHHHHHHPHEFKPRDLFKLPPHYHGPLSHHHKPKVDYEKLAHEIFHAQNRIRKNPWSFIPLLEEKLKFFEGNTLYIPGEIPLITNEGPAAVKEAIDFLKNQKNLPEFRLSEAMSRAAQDHAEDIGSQGSFSHTGTDGSNASARISRYGAWRGKVGENIDFGSHSAEEIIISFLVDDGNKHRGHRKNLFHTEFSFTGIAACGHTEMEICAVIDYASEYLAN